MGGGVGVATCCTVWVLVSWTRGWVIFWMVPHCHPPACSHCQDHPCCSAHLQGYPNFRTSGCCWTREDHPEDHPAPCPRDQDPHCAAGCHPHPHPSPRRLSRGRWCPEVPWACWICCWCSRSPEPCWCWLCCRSRCCRCRCRWLRCCPSCCRWSRCCPRGLPCLNKQQKIFFPKSTLSDLLSGLCRQCSE